MFRRDPRSQARFTRALRAAGRSMRLLRWREAPAQQYDRVTNDEFDPRIPLHPDEAFEFGIKFNAKYIGSMEVPRPSSRVEIVTAMRRVRYEFKAKGAKKRKVVFDVSTEGVRVLTRPKRHHSPKIQKQELVRLVSVDGGGPGELLHHPIYRIFYVSHDSSDLKIFSYIARDPATNAFKCNVFKSGKKSMAMRIVRTVGQAFEVCHKQLNGSEPPDDGYASPADIAAAAAAAAADAAAAAAAADEKCAASDTASSASGAVSKPAAAAAAAAFAAPAEPAAAAAERPRHLELLALPPPPRKEGRRSPQRGIVTLGAAMPDLPECITKAEESGLGGEAGGELGAHEQKLLRERLEQQAQQTRAAVAQLLLLRDQLAAEQAARCEAQARTHTLLAHNKELLEHVAALVAHLQARERGPDPAAARARPISAHQLTLLPQASEATQDSAFNIAKEKAFLLEQTEKTDKLVDLMNMNKDKDTQNINNNNSPAAVEPLGKMTNEQMQDYLITTFRSMEAAKPPAAAAAAAAAAPKPPGRQLVNYNQYFFQNMNAFPNIPPVNSDLSNLITWDKHGKRAAPGPPMLDTPPRPRSLASSTESTPDGDSSDESSGFIKPLPQPGTLAASGQDGRVRLLVPVSPAASDADDKGAAGGPAGCAVPPTAAGKNVARSTSEKAPHRNELMAALRAQWTRHTTK